MIRAVLTGRHASNGYWQYPPRAGYAEVIDMKNNERFTVDLVDATAANGAARKVKVFGIKSMTVLASLSMVLSGVPTSAIAEELQEAGIIPEATQEQPAEQAEASTSDVSADVLEADEQGSDPDGSSGQESSDSTSEQQSEQISSQRSSTQEQAAEQEQHAEQGQPAATQADIALDLGNAYLLYGGQTITAPATKVTVPTDKDLTFEANCDYC